jgi:hypothetical protein
MDGQKDRQTDKQIDRQTDRQTAFFPGLPSERDDFERAMDASPTETSIIETSRIDLVLLGMQNMKSAILETVGPIWHAEQEVCQVHVVCRIQWHLVYFCDAFDGPRCFAVSTFITESRT